METRIILEVEPIAKPRMTRQDKWQKRPRVMRYWDFCDELRVECMKHHYAPSEKLSLTFILPMPSSWSKKKRDSHCGKHHHQRPDLDNLIKAFKDALLKDDSFVAEYGHMQKVWGETGQIIVHED